MTSSATEAFFASKKKTGRNKFNANKISIGAMPLSGPAGTEAAGADGKHSFDPHFLAAGNDVLHLGVFGKGGELCCVAAAKLVLKLIAERSLILHLTIKLKENDTEHDKAMQKLQEKLDKARAQNKILEEQAKQDKQKAKIVSSPMAMSHEPSVASFTHKTKEDQTPRASFNNECPGDTFIFHTDEPGKRHQPKE
eukprot:CAMPEP_0113327042 /NCGR_PEP_ID=MMETSP0010_2-20120614/18993_1 /TAXON_ID=216773 ORGANISM="Corethron hystrix, Strain 308" /NCGR_SAMPLE_ID=MMETSP0010_2 /ASSEMBLY_ACC=CAM_ASM_000155 /LENGTH=194 /DNA_ID=CAMNT_0000187713 /DNA_START=241 /DNA_END=826 /DNA_ORIENTATION=- /assembly_acc=CAM_ASM_000155